MRAILSFLNVKCEMWNVKCGMWNVEFLRELTKPRESGRMIVARKGRALPGEKRRFRDITPEGR